jgi:pimeloyl-ACP methyl ester carboxylesterase
MTILVPPLLCSARVYEPILDTVWSHGSLSIADTRSDATIAEMAARLLREAPDRFALLGTSMGGYVALEVVRQAPERVEALALVSTSARADTPETLNARRRQSQLVEEGHFDALVDAAFPGVVAARHESDLALRAVWRDLAAVVGSEAFLRQQRAVMGRADLRALLPSIACPTTVIHGAEDRLIPVEMARELAGEIPEAELIVIEHAGHFALFEQSESAVSAVTSFLARAR